MQTRVTLLYPGGAFHRTSVNARSDAEAAKIALRRFGPFVLVAIAGEPDDRGNAACAARVTDADLIAYARANH